MIIQKIKRIVRKGTEFGSYPKLKFCLTNEKEKKGLSAFDFLSFSDKLHVLHLKVTRRNNSPGFVHLKMFSSILMPVFDGFFLKNAS